MLIVISKRCEFIQLTTKYMERAQKNKFLLKINTLSQLLIKLSPSFSVGGALEMLF